MSGAFTTMPVDSRVESYDVRFDAASGILHVVLRGFWSLATVAMFTGKVVTAATAARLRHGPFVVLCDMREFPVQSAAVSGAFRAFIRTTANINGGKVASVVSGMLSRLQVDREMPGGTSRYFHDYDEALAWLTSDSGD